MSSVVYAVGILCGLVLAFMLEFLWIGVAGPFQEWICEHTLDVWYRKKHGLEPQPAPPAEGPISILFSDIHLDTWDYGSGRPAAFASCLQSIVANPRVTDVYINGDILDTPPNPVNQRDVPTLTVDCLSPSDRYPDLNAGPLGILQKLYEVPLRQLMNLGPRPSGVPPLPITYITGNHDIGIEGLRFIMPGLAWGSVQVAWNPSVVLRASADRWVYLEHGHRYDPFLWLYLRYAVLQLFRGPAAVHITQRAGKVGMKHSHPTNLEAAKRAPSLPWENEEEIQHDPHDGVGAWFARYRFRQAARRAFRRIQKEQSDRVKVITFGHTHIPDKYTFPGGRLYINSGDWAGNSPDQSYLIIHSNGVVEGPLQWR